MLFALNLRVQYTEFLYGTIAKFVVALAVAYFTLSASVMISALVKIYTFALIGDFLSVGIFLGVFIKELLAVSANSNAVFNNPY